MSSWEEFYASNKAPSNFDEIKSKLECFCWLHKDELIVLVTSGGTTVPLEHNTVRFVDNFSAGTRGSASAEYFIEAGYNVIFLHRFGSLEPYVRHFMGQKFLDTLVIKNEFSEFSSEEDSNDTIEVRKPTIEVSPEVTPRMLPFLRRYKAATDTEQLLSIGFTSLSDYLWLLREACNQLAGHRFNALIYLAAAVSDFYIPASQMPEHKIQSSAGAPVLNLQLVPKMLAPLVSEWAPEAFVVSFKLETDPKALVTKARKALNTYKHKIVVGNVLDTRKMKVTMVEPAAHYDIILTDDEKAKGIEIEDKIVRDLSARHDALIRNKLETFKAEVTL